MASIEELQSAFMKAHEAGDTENAQILATHLKTMTGNTDVADQSTQQESTQGVSVNNDGGLDISINRDQQYPEGTSLNPNTGQPLDIPSDENLQFNAEQIEANRAPEPTFTEKAGAVAETAGTLATGATTGLAGRVAGTIKGFAQAFHDKFNGKKWNPDTVEKFALEYQDALTNTPESELGQEYLQNTGDLFKPLEAINPAQGMLLGQAARNGATVLKGANPKTNTVSEGQQAVDTAKQSGIDVLTSDVVKPDSFTAKTAQALGERIPIAGTAGKRVKQQEQRVNAVNDLFDQYGAGDIARASDDVMSSLIKKDEANLEKYSGLKNEVIDRISSKGSVDTSKISKALDESINTLDELNLPSSTSSVIKKLEEYKTAFNGKDLRGIEELRKQLGNELKDSNLANIKDTADKAMSKSYEAVRESIGDHIKKHGDRRDFNKWSVANKRLRENINEQKKTALKSIIDKGKVTPEKVKQFLFSQKPSEIRLLYKNLTKEGRQSAKVATMQHVMEKMNIENGQPLSAERFINEMSKVSKTTNIVFNGAEKAQLKGLIETLNMTRRASGAAVNVPTGDRFSSLMLATAGGSTVGVVPTVGIAGGIGLLARAYESKPVRNALIKVGQAKTQGSKQLAYRAYLKVIQNPELGLVAIQDKPELKKLNN